MVDITIVGGGPVGLFGAFYAGLRGLKTTIIDSLPELGGQLMALYPEKYIYDMPGFPKVLAKDLAKHLTEQAMQFDPDVILGQTAQGLRAIEGGYELTTSDGAKIQTRKIILAAGIGAFAPTPLGLPNEEALHQRGLFYGVQNTSIFEGLDLAIIGGGDSAMDWCLNLEPVAKTITLVHRRDGFRAHEDTVQRVKASSVRMRLFNVVKELHGEQLLEGITLENTQTKELEHLPVHAIIVNVGFKSSLGPIKEWGIDIKGNSIVVDQNFETNLPGIFAAGDVCTYGNKVKLIATGVGEITTAVCVAKTQIDPSAKMFPGHSSDMDLSSPSH